MNYNILYHRQYGKERQMLKVNGKETNCKRQLAISFLEDNPHIYNRIKERCLRCKNDHVFPISVRDIIASLKFENHWTIFNELIPDIAWYVKHENRELFLKRSFNDGNLPSDSKEITKEQYEKALKNEGSIPKELEDEVFGICLSQGYGIYTNEVYTEDGKYYVYFNHGSTAD